MRYHSRVSETPLISILLPVRDAEEFLPACLDSLIGQSFKDWECLAVDDGSRDRSAAVLDEWRLRDRRIRVMRMSGEGGIVRALEAARREARGSVLARQDADDRSLPERLARQAETLERHPDLAAVGALTRPEGRISGGMSRYLDWLSGCVTAEICAREIWIESPLAHPTAMMRAAAIRGLGGYREIGWPEDYDLWLRLHRAGQLISNVAEVLYCWRDHPDRLSRRDPRYSPAAFLRCRLHHLRRHLAEKKIVRPLIVWGAGRDGRRLARGWEEETRSAPPAPEIVGFVDIDPRKIGRERRGRPVLDMQSAMRAHPEAFFLVAVGVPGARELIRDSLRAEGREEGADFLCLH